MLKAFVLLDVISCSNLNNANQMHCKSVTLYNIMGCREPTI